MNLEFRQEVEPEDINLEFRGIWVVSEAMRLDLGVSTDRRESLGPGGGGGMFKTPGDEEQLALGQEWPPWQQGGHSFHDLENS